MKRCLELAARGAGYVAPNPMVGAVLVFNDRIIGEGYHEQYGQAHAEVNCINSVTDKSLVSRSTLYVSLEPCSHFGKTPPCADLIIANRIPAVVIGCRDSFDAVDGRGIEKLRASGVDVTVGILEQECLDLNRRFFTFHERKRPYVILKWAQTADGFIGSGVPGTRTLISNDITNRLVHKWRSEEAAILVGKNTALMDDPSLTTRLWPGKDPLRLVIDINLDLTGHLKLFNRRRPTIVFNSVKDEEGNNLRFMKLAPGYDMLFQVLNKLYHLQVQSLIVEGGSRLLQSFIDEGLWDEARVITNSSLALKAGLTAPTLPGFSPVHELGILHDIVSFYRKEH